MTTIANRVAITGSPALTASLWFAIARNAALASRPKSDWVRDQTGSPLVAIVFAAIALDSMLSDMGALLLIGPRTWPRHLKFLGEKLKGLVDDRRGPECIIREWCLGLGAKADFGRSPLQTLKEFISLRNAIVHYRTDWISPNLEPDAAHPLTVEEKAILSRLPRKIRGDGGAHGMSLVDLVSNQEAALWSCRAVATSVRYLVDLLPAEHSPRSILVNYCESSLLPPDSPHCE